MTNALPLKETAQAYDCEGNKRLSGGDNFLVWLEGPATVHAKMADKGDGSYIATYQATAAGMYDLYLTNGEAFAHAV